MQFVTSSPSRWNLCSILKKPEFSARKHFPDFGKKYFHYFVFRMKTTASDSADGVQEDPWVQECGAAGEAGDREASTQWRFAENVAIIFCRRFWNKK